MHVGSAAEYGPVPGGVPVSEQAEPRPVGPYGVSKLAGTELVLASGLDAAVLRVFDVVGPGAPTASLFGRLAEGLRRALERDENQVRMPDLSGYRDFVDVRDVARAIRAAAVSAATGVINIGSGHAVRARDAAQLLVRASGFEGSIVEENRQVLLPAQAGGAGGDHLPGHHHQPGPYLPGHRAEGPRPEGRAVPGEPVPWRGGGGGAGAVAAGGRAHRQGPSRMADTGAVGGVARGRLAGDGLSGLSAPPGVPRARGTGARGTLGGPAAGPTIRRRLSRPSDGLSRNSGVT